MFENCFKLIWWRRIQKWPSFFKILLFLGIFCIFAQFLKHEKFAHLIVYYLSKTTFYQIFDCISLKVLNTGSLQIFANPCKFASQLCQKKFKKCLSIFLVKWVYHKLYIFLFQIFDTNWPSLMYKQQLFFVHSIHYNYAPPSFTNTYP